MKRILVAADLTAGSAAAVGRACRIANAQSAELRFLHVLHAPATEREREAARLALHDQVENHSAAPQGVELDLAITVVDGNPAESILDEAGDFAADLVVLGTHGEPKLSDAIFGTVGSHVMRHSNCPVLVVQDDDGRPYEQILAAIGGDEDDRLLQMAFTISTPKDVHIVHAYGSAFESLFGTGDVMEDVRTEQEVQLLRVRRSLAAAGVPASSVRLHNVVREGDVMDVIGSAWREAEPDLLVMGTHGRGGIARLFLGSYAEHVLFGYRSDILILRSGGRTAAPA
ncbi:universal stress protein [Sphingosinicella sp. YJ22]|uniref:universal stress protein n=1 Tax=Sphingosinicella sp. YJ22 TaxID=1104780 RepID=UPI00140D2428|nr:universal stress protein [Sphingosinicella sp. YJ22]